MREIVSPLGGFQSPLRHRRGLAGGGGGGGGGGGENFALVRSIDFTSQPGTEWVVTTDQQGRTLDAYDRILFIFDQLDEIQLYAQLSADGGATWYNTTADYDLSQKYNAGQSYAADTAIQIGSGGLGAKGMGWQILTDMGLAAEKYCEGIIYTETVSWNLLNRNYHFRHPVACNALRVFSGSIKATSTMEIWGTLK